MSSVEVIIFCFQTEVTRRLRTILKMDKKKKTKMYTDITVGYKDIKFFFDLGVISRANILVEQMDE